MCWTPTGVSLALNPAGHREPHNQTAFACTAPGAGQHRDYVFKGSQTLKNSRV